MKKLNKSDTEFFKSTFLERDDLNHKNEDFRGNLLLRTLNFELNQCNQYFTKDCFENYFYEPKVFKDFDSYLKIGLKKYKYNYIHSYGKNGKSTYIKHFIKECEKGSDYKPYLFDFSQVEQKANQSADKKVRSFIKSEYLSYLKLNNSEYVNNPFYHFILFLQNKSNHSEGFKNQEDKSLVRIISQLNNLFYKKLTKSKEFFNLGTLNVEKAVNLLFKKSSKFSTTELFNLLIALLSFKAAKIDSEKSILFIFDNLDDVYTYIPEDVKMSYSASILSFHNKLSTYFIDIFKCHEDGLNLSIKFIYVYRTSNYLSAVYSHNKILTDSQNHLDEFRMSAHKYRLTSVSNSFIILKKRLDFYNIFCEYLGIIKSPRFELIERIEKSFRTAESEYQEIFGQNIEKLLRLWNGNKLRFAEFIINASFSPIDLKYIIDKENNIDSQIKVGILFHYYIRFFKERYLDNPSTEFLKYSTESYKNDQNQIRCSLSRLFFTFLFNKREKNRGIETIEDTLSKGIKFLDFIDELDKIELKGEKAYNQEDIKKMLNSLFSYEIDHWGNYVSCCAPIKVKKKTSFEKYKFLVNLNEFLKKLYKKGKRDELNYPSFYYNDSAPYYMFSVKRSFEYFSINADQQNLSLTSSLVINHFKNGNKQYLFEKPIIDAVYEVKKCTEVTVFFFNKYFGINKINSFIDGDFCYKKKFFFDDLISKIIGYLEEVRYAAVNEVLVVSGNVFDENKIKAFQIINEFFISKINELIIHFFYLLSELNLEEEKIPKSLKDSKKGFETLKKMVVQISEYNYLDFKTRIKSRQ